MSCFGVQVNPLRVAHTIHAEYAYVFKQGMAMSLCKRTLVAVGIWYRYWGHHNGVTFECCLLHNDFDFFDFQSFT